MYGRTEPLIILPFDHRTSFSKGLFNTENPDPETRKKIKDMKSLIYEAIFQVQKKTGLPKNQLGILVDETYGDHILADAASKGIPILQTTEKSGLEEFDFEYGDAFGEHLLRYPATFAKALVRFNPDGDEQANSRSLIRLKTLSDFCHQNNIKLLIEPLLPATLEQLESVAGSKERFDQELRPELCKRMVITMQEAGIECDVWKIEGFENPESYTEVLKVMQNTEERKEVGLVTLGRNETQERVITWITAGKGIPGILGFAVGRTVFWEPLVEYRDGKMTKEETVSKIANNFNTFVDIFLR